VLFRDQRDRDEFAASAVPPDVSDVFVVSRGGPYWALMCSSLKVAYFAASGLHGEVRQR
jgi:hypothetical protein